MKRPVNFNKIESASVTLKNVSDPCYIQIHTRDENTIWVLNTGYESVFLIKINWKAQNMLFRQCWLNKGNSGNDLGIVSFHTTDVATIEDFIKWITIRMRNFIKNHIEYFY